MRYLVLSDIHANWEALEAVLEHSARHWDQILCCGDLIGYGADPNAVVDWARANLKAVVRGNHDKASVGLEDLEWFNPVAKAAALWTRAVLTAENAEYVRRLPSGPLYFDGFEVVHGSPVDEDEYVVGPDEAAPAFSYLDKPVTFFGHTHLQGGFSWRRQKVRAIAKPNAQTDQMPLELEQDCAYLINPGSIGQPRDGDARAAYVIYDTDQRHVSFHRLPYDVNKAQAKIRRAGLPGALADRLAVGR